MPVGMTRHPTPLPLCHNQPSPAVIDVVRFCRRFEAGRPTGALAFLDYTIEGDRITFEHTFVPVSTSRKRSRRQSGPCRLDRSAATRLESHRSLPVCRGVHQAASPVC